MFFPDIEQVFTILISELPDGVYAMDRADSTDPSKNSYSSSEIRATASIYEDLYQNLQDIYLNKFLTTVQPDEIARWEADLFAVPPNQSLPFLQRQANAITKYRATGGLSYTYINGLVGSILDPIPYSVKRWGCTATDTWTLDYSALDTETFLSPGSPILGKVQGAYSLDCFSTMLVYGNIFLGQPIVSGLLTEETQHIVVGAGVSGVGIPSNTTITFVSSNGFDMSANATSTHTHESIQIQNYLESGLTPDEFQGIQQAAYTIGIYIYGVASADQIATLEQTLDQAMPAGSTYVIYNNFPEPMDPIMIDLGGGSECTLIGAFDCGNGLIGATYHVLDLMSEFGG